MLTLARTLLVTTLTLLTIAALTGLTVARTLLVTTLALTILALLTRLIATLTLTVLALLTRLVTALTGLTVARTLLIATTLIVVLAWTIASTLGCTALETGSKAFRTETTLFTVVLMVALTLIGGALACMNTRTR